MNQNTEYEILAKEIYEKILKEDGYENIEVKHNVKLKGKSGCSHQIDVYWDFNMGGINHKVAIECKNYKSKVSIGKIRDFKSVIEDLNVRGIFISREGFQSGAIEYAKHHGIDLKEIRYPKDQDWDGLIKTVSITLNMLSIKVKKRIPLIDKNWIEENTNYKKGDTIPISGQTDQIKIYDSDNNEITNFYKLDNQLKTFNEKKLDIEHVYTFENAFIKDFHGILLKIKGIKYVYDSLVSKDEMVIDSGDFVKVILKDLKNNEIKFFNK
ncbi:restriction endonuclease [uncultured Ilyobacter sp.]|uniref:restriction endonuclease n=1 Tax=uncultured Ilyobacter sp. TaxID=544433 RepID=UPI002AA6F8A8|nr:restriction endonuclease [uncultured Ilyobacter sp.]